MPQKKLPLYFKFDGTVWKILCDSETPLVAVEVRDHENREVSFTLIDSATKEIIWQGNHSEELWWAGIEAFNNGVLFLHGYTDIQFPEHKGIWALSEKGKLLWVEKELSFLGGAAGSLYAYKKGEGDAKHFYLLNSGTGKVQKEVEAEEALQALANPDVNTHVHNPAHYKADNQYFPKLAAFIQQITMFKAAIAVDYLEYKNKIIISFYTVDNEKLNSRLLLISEEGIKETEELTGTELSGIGIDTFFVSRDILFFVKNKKELVLYSLTT